ncbi:hypothetical protein J2Y66_003464 [Paenarthrobacter nitroguajacolicus]|nr:hypothetical protein [Paenarthrobacter nitroguajacolicus]
MVQLAEDGTDDAQRQRIILPAPAPRNTCLKLVRSGPHRKDALGFSGLGWAHGRVHPPELQPPIAVALAKLVKLMRGTPWLARCTTNPNEIASEPSSSGIRTELRFGSRRGREFTRRGGQANSHKWNIVSTVLAGIAIFPLCNDERCIHTGLQRYFPDGNGCRKRAGPNGHWIKDKSGAEPSLAAEGTPLKLVGLAPYCGPASEFRRAREPDTALVITAHRL